MTQPLVHPKAFSLQIFLPSGDPQGVRIIDRANWTGQGVAFSRSYTKEALNRPELQRTGVYILWTRDDAEALPPAYIGEAEQVSSRLNDHARSKDFWTNAVAFTTKDDSLDKASVQHLEARLVELANAAGRCTLENAVIPKRPSLLEARAADAERFLEDILLCLPIIGVRFFEARALPASTDDAGSEPGMMTIDFSNARAERLQGVVAHGYEDGDEFVIVAGSLAVREEADAFPNRFPHESAYRKQLLEQGILVEDKGLSNAYRFTRDHACSSPSRAAGVIRGTASNGREDWKDANGRSLNDLAKLEQQDEIAQ